MKIDIYIYFQIKYVSFIVFTTSMLQCSGTYYSSTIEYIFIDPIENVFHIYAIAAG